MNETYHIPALLNESIDALNIKPEGVYIDATFGGGGHSSVILDKLTTGKLIAFDQDIDAHNNKIDKENFVLLHSNFQHLKQFLDYLKIETVDGILADLGISTHHIDEPQRGFSFRFDAKLDMRMNRNQVFDAKKLINSYREADLKRIFKNYGDLKNNHQLAVAISKARRKKEISTTFELVEVVEKFILKKAEQKFLAKIFQAIRIEVNDELGTLKSFLEQIPEVLNENGRVAIISYHSLEDKLVKNFFRTGNFDGKRETDMYGNILRPLSPINNKVIVPSENEIKKNNRARSAKLRIAEKLK